MGCYSLVMEATRKSSKRKSAGNSSGIKNQYVAYLLKEGKQPPSVFQFCLDNGWKEEDFYKVAGSFEGLDRLIWKELIESVTNRVSSDRAFGDFSVREQILTFYFGLFERFKTERSYIVYHLGHSKPEVTPGYLKDFKKVFEDFFNQRINEGKGKGEVATRPLLDRRYPQLFWLHFGFLLLFWKNDDSADFEQTDAAIEKSVNLAFELISKGALDTAIDFAKFIYQSKTK